MAIPKAGDNVQVSFTGYLVRPAKKTDYGVPTDTAHNYWLVRSDDLPDMREVFVSVHVMEKVPDPEPEWVNGDVVQYIGHGDDYRYHLIGGKWIHADGTECSESPSDWWPDRVRVVLKVDAS